MQKLVSACIIGKPNAGKSTLLNSVLGQKLSIVTPKVQTTRSVITGILSDEDTQIILYDTPGLFSPKRSLEKAMVRCAWSSIHGADILFFLIDVSRDVKDDIRSILQRIMSFNLKPVFLFNKIDLNYKFVEKYREFVGYYVKNPTILEISALYSKNIDGLLNILKQNAIEASWIYDKDDMTNVPMYFLASEITREQLFLELSEELPYNLTVQNEKWEKLDNGSINIYQNIVVMRESQKKIIIGRGGANIKKIGIVARQSIEHLTDSKVNLFLFVKVRKDWDNKSEYYDSMRLKM